jgi:hypothetical protein
LCNELYFAARIATSISFERAMRMDRKVSIRTDVNLRLSVNLRLGPSNVRFSDGQSLGAWISRTFLGINTFVEGSINVRLSIVFCEMNYNSRLAPGLRLH